ncbi:MAG: hypothetical protein DMG06_28060 [Acidobacteria bacterium]|nr:MAG: hypothetical protein DMG06_28060 [Acidobacteriota bacterium]
MKTRKIDALVGSDPSRFEYGNTFESETVSGHARLRIGFDDAQDACVRELAADLAGPFQLLYLLHTTRTGSDLGRYESPELTTQQVQEFLHRFGPFLAQDARHDFWVRSHDDDATIVLDRHNIIYAYGPLAMFEAALLRIGARRAGIPHVPDPHVHHYHHDWDAYEREILKALPWTRKPLREADVQ